MNISAIRLCTQFSIILQWLVDKRDKVHPCEMMKRRSVSHPMAADSSLDLPHRTLQGGVGGEPSIYITLWFEPHQKHLAAIWPLMPSSRTNYFIDKGLSL